MENLLKRMSENRVFACLEEVERCKLSRIAIRRKYGKGEFIAYYGDIWPYLFLITEGAIDAFKESSEGRSLTIISFGVGEIFWGPAFFEEGLPMPVTLAATMPTILHIWPREKMLPILKQNGAMSWEMCCQMICRMLHASEIVEELAFQTVARRLARLLMEQFSSGKEQSVQRSLTLDEMAARIGTTREMVCRALYRFADKKMIEVTRTEFILTDKDSLRRMAEGV